MKTLIVGGEERAVRIRYRDAVLILRRYNLVYRNACLDFQRINKLQPGKYDHVQIPNMFFFWVLWKCLKKRGIYPFRKPFRSLVHMISQIEMDEVQSIVTFIGDTILHTPTKGDREQGNETRRDRRKKSERLRSPNTLKP